jgi:hypothetical protein
VDPDAGLGKGNVVGEREVVARGGLATGRRLM